MRKFSKIFLIVVASAAMFSFRMITDNWAAVSVDDMTKKIKEIEGFYKDNSAYTIKVTHASYKSYSATVAEEKSQGYFIKDAKNNYHSFAMGIHTVQNAKLKITVDSVNKSILINDPDKTYTKAVKTDDLSGYLKVCDQIKKIKGTNYDRFRFEFGKTQTFSAYEIWTGTDNRIEKLVMFFNAEFPSDPNEEKSAKTKPRAEIIFSDYKTTVKPVYKDHFDETKYITLKDGNYVASDKYKGCKVYDLRTKK